MNPINVSTSQAVFWWKPAAWLRVTGPDAAVFLQGQFTNEVRGLAKGGAVYGLWLSVKGKVLADSFLLRGREEEEFWLGSYFSGGAVIRERLESHIIADDVTLEDVTSSWEAVSVWSAAGNEVALPADGFCFPGRRGRAQNTEWIFPGHQIAAMRSRFAGMRELGSNEVARMRIAAGIPAIPSDVGPGDLPQEGGLEADAISYTKGCYLGQEVMARLKSMGQVRRRLRQITSQDDKLPLLPAEVFVAERKAGELRSIAPGVSGGYIGLAMLSLLPLGTETTLALAPNGPRPLHLGEAP